MPWPGTKPEHLPFIEISLQVIKLVRIHWRLSTILKTSNKSVQSNVSWYVKVYIYSESLFNTLTIHWDKTQMNVAQIALLFFRELQLITVLLLIRDSYTSWSTRSIFLKLCVGFSISDSVSLLFIFLSNVIVPFKIKIIAKPHTVLLPDLWFLSCDKKFENGMVFAWVGASQKLT